MKFVTLNKLKTIFVLSLVAIFMHSCLKPYACECDHPYTKQKSHVLVYSTKNNKENACAKNSKDTTVVCTVKE
ncbi:MAG: hypothetical protein JNK50_03725 [Bacteroidia bacterium]|nr:hypothetical protein [Bacteroidia bacterium]